MEVKLFGGADMFKRSVANVRNLTVGWQNIAIATECLKMFGLVPSATDTGGCRGRKLIFKTDSGAVFIKKMSSQGLDQIPLCR